MRHRLSFFCWFPPIFYVLLLGGCADSDPAELPGDPAQKSSEKTTNVLEARHAEGFRLTYHKYYKLLEVFNPYQDRTDTLRYALKPRSVELERIPSGFRVIDIPVRTMIATSTTHIALAEMLDANEIITGMVGARFVYNREIRERLEEGKIISFSQGEFNKEEALALAPDLIMVSAGQSSQFDDYNVLQDAGIDVFVNSEWLETTPLGKAEWVKVMAALLNREQLAGKKFRRVAERYRELKSRVGDITDKPLVINNLPYKGTWYVSGGDSYIARYFKDAGADYSWYDNTARGGVSKDFEVVYDIGLKADIWLNPGSAGSMEEILQKDKRFSEFKSFKTGRIYNNIERMSSSGGNDFWESGVVHPERILADLIHILHPRILPGHTLYYYQKLDNDG